MPHPAITPDQSREIDRRAVHDYGISSLVLMENAGRGVTDRITRDHQPTPTVICCGKGNNGGDGFVIARHLHIRGWPVRVLTTVPDHEYTGDAAANLHILRHTNVTILAPDDSTAQSAWHDALAGAACIVDALLGTGTTGDPRPPVDAAIHAINALPRANGNRVIAVDLPSGLDAASGMPGHPTVVATETCTFVAPKSGFANPAARPHLGRVEVLDIGTPPQLLDEVLAAGNRT